MQQWIDHGYYRWRRLFDRNTNIQNHQRQIPNRQSPSVIYQSFESPLTNIFESRNMYRLSRED